MTNGNDDALKRADALCRELFDIRSDPATMVEFATRETARLRAALKKILDIDNQESGGDWDEIEQAREVAHEALFGR